MKTINKYLMAALGAAVLTMGVSVKADDDGIVASPRLRQQLNEAKRVSDSGGDKIDRSLVAVSPRAKALADSFLKGGADGGDKIHRELMTHSPKLHEATEMDFRVAPVK